MTVFNNCLQTLRIGNRGCRNRQILQLCGVFSGFNEKRFFQAVLNICIFVSYFITLLFSTYILRVSFEIYYKSFVFEGCKAKVYKGNKEIKM